MSCKIRKLAKNRCRR